MDIRDLAELLNRNAVFHCSRRGGGISSKDFAVVHTLAQPLNSDNMPDWISPSLLSIYQYWHGLKLFQPSKDVEEGFKLFSLPEVSAEWDELSRILADNRGEYRKNTHFKDIDPWLDGLIPIAEIMSSGDKFVLDTYRRTDAGESPIVYLDHEAYYGDVCDPEEMVVVAKDVYELLDKILREPLKYVASNWVGGDYNEQWYPESVTYI